MRLSLGDLYDFALNAGAVGVLLWFVYFMSKTFGAPVTRGWLIVNAVSIAVFVGLLWAVIKPDSKVSRAKVIAYGVTAGLTIGVGIMVWGGWLPPIPMG